MKAARGQQPLELAVMVRPDPIAAYVARWVPVLGRLATERKARELAELQTDEAAERPANPRPLRPGHVVRFTARALRSMYGGKQYAPVRAPDERWTVAECACGMCTSGSFVAVDQVLEGYEGQRHIARAALEHAPTASLEPDPAEHAAVLAAVGVWQDEDGVWWVRPCP